MIARACLFALLLVAPFEPRFTVPLGAFRVSLVEAVGLVCFMALTAVWIRRGRSLRLSPALLALGLFVFVCLVSASLAAVDPGRSLKFALRLGAMGGFALLVSRLDASETIWGFRALLISGSMAAALALAEGLGVRALDVFLGVFRETPFNVAGLRRATGGSEYPNLGAGMMVYALLAGVVLLRSRPVLRSALVVLVAGGLAFTYSRGAWVAGLVGLLALAAFERRREGVRRPLVPVALYLIVLGVFVGSDEISRIRFGGESASDFYRATYETPRHLALDPGARVPVRVKITNVGRRPWGKEEAIHLSYHLYEDAERPLVDGPRTLLPRDVRPGESATLEATLLAPTRAGEYLLMWDLVHEHTTWFSGQGVKPGVARLIVGQVTGSTGPAPPSETQALTAIAETIAWRPSRLELWGIAARMWAAYPFFGAGPDNFRWTHGTLAGKAAFDTRVFANNTFLEFAATLGTFGLSAFAAVLIFALLAGFRAAARADEALIAFAILVAMTTHGLADYLLAFTGHYLVFGFAVGVLSGDGEREP
ncbi:MAG: O-antigen ligase family protein [Vicinamibacteria bacterium]|nr:O-antigen ligase family protein [Vicinamibacteria bacterium]